MRADHRIDTDSRETKHNHMTGRSASGGVVNPGSVPVVVGAFLTVVFYLVAPRVPGAGQFVYRYFQSHPVEYAASAMCFIGLAILGAKRNHLAREKAAMRLLQKFAERAGELTSSGNHDTQSGAVGGRFERLQSWMDSQLLVMTGTGVQKRVRDALQYVHGGTDQRLEDHLRYLADLAADRLNQSYSLLRTITWAIPILGFLGTVLGITIAIANVTPEQLDSSLPEVTAGLAVAFDTTAQALGMSIVLVFGSFLVERGEQSVLNDIEQFGIDHLARWPTAKQATTNSSPLPAIEEWTSLLLRQQSSSWEEHLHRLQSGWSEALAAQSQRLCSALTDETQTTLARHRESVQSARDVYADVLHEAASRISSQLHETLSGFTTHVDAWQNALQTTSLSAAQQAEELHSLGRTLLQMTEAEHRLAQTQQRLNDNLQTLQVVETLEQTVNSLNAAVHVLTAKTQLRSAA